MSLDSFGRLRTSQPFTLFDYHPTSLTATNYVDREYFYTDIDAGGTTVYDTAAVDRITVTGGSASKVVYNSTNTVDLTISASSKSVFRMTKTPMPYQPAKSRLILMTGVPVSRTPAGGENITVRMGLCRYSSNLIQEGIYFETNGSILKFVDNVQGTSTSVSQSEWNIDAFDGNGPSTLNLTFDLLTNILLVFDQQYLGVGKIRCGFYIDGILYYAHQFNHGSLNKPYNTTPRLNIFYQIIGTTVTGGAITCKQICCSCISEGGFNARGRRITINTGTTNVNCGNSTSVKYVILAVRVNSSFPQASFKPLVANLITTTSSTFFIAELQLHSTVGSVGTITGTLTWTSSLDSDIQYSIGDGTIYVSTNGYIIGQDVSLSKSTANIISSEFDTYLQRITFTQFDTLVLVAYGIVNMTVSGNVTLADLM